MDRFKPGTTPGEAAWLIAKAAEVLSPAAPALFSRQLIQGQATIDLDAWLDTAQKVALGIQQRAFKATGIQEGGELCEN